MTFEDYNTIPMNKIGNICRDLRIKHNRTAASVIGRHRETTLYLFEKGKSRNVNLLALYIQLAKECGELDSFVSKVINLMLEGESGCQKEHR